MAPRIPEISTDSSRSPSPEISTRWKGDTFADIQMNHGYEDERDDDDKIVVVVGVGYVGEHLVQVFSKNFMVYGFDVSPARVAHLKRTSFANNPRVRLTTDPSVIEQASLICISVPTLLKEGNAGIDDSYVRSAVSTIERHVCAGTTVVMESSVTVGMTRQLLGNMGRTAGVYVGFSPERVDPGRTEPPAEEIPKILSGLTDEALRKVVSFYGKVYSKIVPVSSCETAEMCKLYENCFRMVNIAYANEMGDACKTHGINPYEVVQASATKPFGFMPFQPSVGVGGHCIPVNPYYLFTNCDFPLLSMATKRMEERPIKLALEMLAKHKKAGKPLQRILIVGVAFKPGQSVMSYSPALSFARALMDEDRDVTVYDPLLQEQDLRKRGLKSLNTEDFSLETLQDQFDSIAVMMRQHRVNFNLVDNFQQQGGIVEYFCQ